MTTTAHARQHYNLTLAILTMAGTAYALQQTMVFPALSTFEHEFNTTPAWATWVLTAFLLTASVATPLLGKLGDQYGKEKVLVISLSIFLAGSIEMGAASDWQTALTTRLPPGLIVLNPRRDAWDASWRQSIDDLRFREQVAWELDGLERADVIAMWFVPDTRAPITLLELGLHARGGKLVVGCPDGYWRKGNVEVVCARYGIPLVTELADLIQAIRQRVGV